MSPEHEGFTMIFNEHYPGLCRFLEAIMDGRKQLAEEIAQETFLRLYKMSDEAIRKGEERFWLYRVAHNLALNEISKLETRKRFFSQVQNLFRTPAPTPEMKTEQKERRRFLRGLLQTLSEPQRAALLLREQRDMSYREIASVLNVSESKVKVDIFRARKALLARWQELESVSHQ